jgi:hypothetical protein
VPWATTVAYAETFLVDVGRILKPRRELLRSFARNCSLTAIARHEALPKVPSNFLFLFVNPFRMPLRTFQRRRSPDKESQA